MVGPTPSLNLCDGNVGLYKEIHPDPCLLVETSSRAEALGCG